MLLPSESLDSQLNRFELLKQMLLSLSDRSRLGRVNSDPPGVTELLLTLFGLIFDDFDDLVMCSRLQKAILSPTVTILLLS